MFGSPKRPPADRALLSRGLLASVGVAGALLLGACGSDGPSLDDAVAGGLSNPLAGLSSPLSGPLTDTADFGRSVYSPFETADAVWHLELVGDGSNGIVVVDADKGLGVAGTASGSVVGVDVEFGEELWSVDLSGGVAVDGAAFAMFPTLVEDRVYVAASTGVLHALDASTGATIWEAEIGGLPAGFPVIVGDAVIVARNIEGIYDDAVVFAGGTEVPADGGVIAFDTTAGTQLWEHGEGFDSTVAAGDAVVYVTSSGGDAEESAALSALAAATGGVLWEAPNVGALTPAAVSPDVVLVAALDVVGLDPASGSELWRTEPDFCRCVFQFPTLVDGVAVVAANDGLVYGFDALTGAERWTVRMGDAYSVVYPGPAGLAAIAADEVVGWVDVQTGQVLAGATVPEGGAVSIGRSDVGEVVGADGGLTLFVVSSLDP